MSQDDAVLEGIIVQFVDSTLDALTNLKTDTKNLDVDQIKTKFIEDWSTLFTIFKTDNRRIKEILEELKKFIFPAIEQDYITRVKELYKIFYQQTISSSIVKELYRKMIYQFLTDFISSSKEWMIDEDTHDILRKFINILKNADNLEVSLNSLRKMFENATSISEIQLEKKISSLMSLLHIEDETKGEVISRADGKSKIILRYFKLSKEVIDFLCSEKVIGKNAKDQYIVLDYDVFDENLFFLLIYAHIIQNINRFDIYRAGAFISYVAILFILATLPEIQDDLFDINPQYKEEFGKKYGDEQTNIGVLPKSWLEEKFYNAYIKDLLQLIAFFLGGNAWYEKIKISLNIDELIKSVKTRLKRLNRWEKGEKIYVKIPILIQIRAMISRIRAGARTSSI